MDLIISNGTAIIVADSADYGPANSLGTRTHQIDLTSLASGAYRQSDKIDFGATRAREWFADGQVEPDVAPAATGVIELFIGWSPDGTAGTNNPANLTGSDAAYVGYGAAATDADECIHQLDFIGAFSVGNDLVVQRGAFGLFVPKMRYGIIVVRNGTNQAFESDAVEMGIRLTPIQESAE